MGTPGSTIMRGGRPPAASTTPTTRSSLETSTCSASFLYTASMVRLESVCPPRERLMDIACPGFLCARKARTSAHTAAASCVCSATDLHTGGVTILRSSMMRTVHMKTT